MNYYLLRQCVEAAQTVIMENVENRKPVLSSKNADLVHALKSVEKIRSGIKVFDEETASLRRKYQKLEVLLSDLVEMEDDDDDGE